MTLDVRYWHEPADPERPLIGRYRVLSGRHMLNASSSHFKLKPTFLQSRCHGGPAPKERPSCRGRFSALTRIAGSV